MHPSQLAQIQRSLGMSSTVGASVAQELLAEVMRLRALLEEHAIDPDPT